MTRSWRKFFKNKLYVVIMVLIFSVALSAVISLLKSVETQSLLEQESLTPAFDVISQEIMKPLYIAETIAYTSSLKKYMLTPDIYEAEIKQELKQFSEELNLEFFVASELNRTQFNSDGSTVALEENSVEWYFREKYTEDKISGVLGNRSNIGIYFDVKTYDKDGRFLGFIGTNKKLATFISAFENFKIQFGYDFIFVDSNDKVVLSSDTTLVADGKRIMQLEQLPWYSAFLTKKNSNENKTTNDSIYNHLVTINGEDILISQTNLDSLNWKLFLVNPLKIRQYKATEEFIIQAIFITITLFTAILIVWLIIRSLQGEFARRHQKDPLTQLPNRSHLTWYYETVASKGQSIAVIMVDLDHFKEINDTYGHSAGDLALCEVANLLKSLLRDNDIVARWGGEEFVIVLPAANVTIASYIAERARCVIAKHVFMANNKVINITASFGVSADDSKPSLAKLISKADVALYDAKNNGRNKVCIEKDLDTRERRKVYATG